MATTNTTTGTTSGSAADLFAKIGGSSSSSSSSSTSSTSKTNDMQSSFLTLLTEQLKNQDPLNPLDNSQVTSQLAQINTVNGIEKLNTTMTQLMSAYAGTQTMQAAAVIGKHVLTAGNSLSLASGQAVAGIKLDAAADHVKVTIKDAKGNVVQTTDLGSHAAGTFNFVWDGKNDAGETLADGDYKFTVEASKGGESVDATALKLGMVNAVTMTSSGFVLDLGDQGTVAFKDVQQII